MKNKTAQLIGALLLIGAGSVAVRDLYFGAGERILPHAFRELIFLGPGLVALGLLMLGRCSEACRKIRARKNVLAAGLFMLGIGAGSFLLALATDKGGDASWASGQMAVMIAIFVGVPGLFLTLAGCFIRQEAK
jgi:hypothetical protein